MEVPMSAYGDVYIGNGGISSEPPPDGTPVVEFPLRDNLSDFKPLGFSWGGHLWLMGHPDPVTVEQFNEVVGGDLGNGWSLSYEAGDAEDV